MPHDIEKTEIKFCGAAGIVTGSCYWVNAAGGQFLVDCGMFQGTKTVRELNYGDFGFDPSKVSFVLLTHAHIDHSGLLPKLVAQGFKGKIYTTEATRDLLEYMLPDSANIQETEVLRLNRKNARRGLPEVDPIYTMRDAEKCLEQIEHVHLGEWLDLPHGIKARFWNAWHILGSASIEIKIPGAHILFSGDLGPEEKIGTDSGDRPQQLDYIVTESTYGSRARSNETIEARRQELKKEILEAVAAKGNIIIPAFAVERTQELLMDLDYLADHNEIPELPLFIDSPLATRVTSVFTKHRCELEETAGKDCPFHGKNIRYTQSVEESKSLNRIKSGAIIMSASGMCEAGRIRHHLRNNLWNPRATVLFTGYQAEGTLGQLIESGIKKVRIHGEEIDVRARIRTISGYSAHADQTALVNWVKKHLPVTKNIFLTHGTDESRAGFRRLLTKTGIDQDIILTPMLDDIFRLDRVAAEKVADGVARLIPAKMTPTDWHNDYASFVLDLAQFLRGLKDDGARLSLLRDLSGHISLQNEPKRKNGRK